ncbi:hypothetical protein SAMN05880592_1291 [Bosea sp. TND4EK4]|nr:hypothetical protein SAMN05880592_1291 [Bosea sp. TND4EK4]
METDPVNRVAGALIGVGALLGGAWLLNSESGRLATGRWSFTKSIKDDRGTFFRLQVKVAYKNAPVEFDIVVACNIRQIKYKDGSNTTEVGMMPVVFGKRMFDNKGLVIRSPDACSPRYIKEGWVPDDLLPVLVVYDNADTLTFGTAYMSEDAYRSPLAELRFDGAKIFLASRAEFEEFRKQNSNLVSRNMFFSAQMGPDLLKSRGLEPTQPFGNHCYAYARYRIPESIREDVRRGWPSDRPRYWDPGPTPSFAAALWDAERQRDIGGAFRSREGWAADGGRPANMGVARSNGGGQIGPPQVRSVNRWGPSYYPVYSDNNASRSMPPRVEDWSKYIRQTPDFVGQKVDFRDGITRGFAYCYSAPVPADSPIGPARNKKFEEAIGAWLQSPVLHQVDGTLISGALPQLSNKVIRIIERDEYFFAIAIFSLEGNGGDV